jgi:nitroreductase
MQAIDALLQRHSGRALTEPAPDDGALGLILESATRAPDHGRLRPWRFIVIRTAGRPRFGDLLADQMRRNRNAAGAAVTPEALERERQKAFRAPLIIVVAAVIKPDGKIPAIEQMLAAGAAAQNILLATFALGFNAVWKTGAAAYDEVVKQDLGLEPKDAIVGFLYVGTDEGPALASMRPPWREFVRHWG